MTLPTLYPAGYAGTSKDFLKVKIDREGSERVAYGVVAVPAATAAAVNIGLIPFQKGARLASFYGYVDDLDTGTAVTLNLGYIYDDNVGNTNKLNAFLSAVTTAQTGGALAQPATVDFATWTATANGWLVVNVQAGPTTTLGNISFRVGLVYDVGGLPT